VSIEHEVWWASQLVCRFVLDKTPLLTEDGNHEPEINDRINRRRAVITKLNSILWDRDVTPKTKTHIYHALVKSTITYAAET